MLRNLLILTLMFTTVQAQDINDYFLAFYWNVTCDGLKIPRNQTTIFYQCDKKDYLIQSKISPEAPEIRITNKSASSIKFIWEESSIVFADGTVSRILPREFSYATRSNFVPSQPIPPKATYEGLVVPLSKITFDTQTRLTYLFDYQAPTAKYTLYLTLEKNKIQETIQLNFEGKK